MADHHADAAVVDRVVGLGVEEGRLQDASRESDLVQPTGRSVDDVGRHAPARAVHRAIQVGHLLGAGPGSGTQKIARVVVRLQRQAVVGRKLVRRADLGHHRSQFSECALLGRVTHPREIFNPVLHRGLHIAHQLQRAGLRLGRKRAAHKHLAQRHAHRLAPGAAADRQNHLLATRWRGRHAADRQFAVIEVCVGKSLGQPAGAGIEQAHRQIAAPGGDGCAGGQLGHAAGKVGLADDQPFDALRPAGQRHQVGRPIKAGRHGGQRSRAERVVAAVWIAHLGARLAGIGQAGLECDQRVERRLAGRLTAGSSQQACGKDAVGRLQAARYLVGLDVIVPVRQAQPALIQAQHITTRVLRVGLHASGQRCRNLHPRQGGQQHRQVLGLVQRRDLHQQRLQRGQAVGFNRFAVHAAGEIRGCLLQPRRGLLRRMGGQIKQALFQNCRVRHPQLVEAANARLARQQFGLRDPAAVHEVIKIGAGVDVGGETFDVEGLRLCLRLSSGRCKGGGRQQRQGEFRGFGEGRAHGKSPVRSWRGRLAHGQGPCLK